MSANNFRKELAKLIEDNTSGSNELVTKLNKLLLNQFNYINFTSIFFEELRESFFTFETIQNYLSELENLIVQNDREKTIEFLKKFDASRNTIYNQIFKNLKPFLKNDIKIITISNSKTILEVIKLADKNFRLNKVIVSESRPQYEGRILIEELSKVNINTEIIVEARIPEFVQQSDLCFIGADSILANGNVVNKIGSKILALICEQFNKPFYVIADSSKFSKNKTFQQLEKPTTEIWNDPPPGVLANNFYFEEVEKEFITNIITDIN